MYQIVHFIHAFYDFLNTLHEDETFRKTYEEERQNFLKEFPTNERNHVDYFITETPTF